METPERPSSGKKVKNLSGLTGQKLRRLSGVLQRIKEYEPDLNTDSFLSTYQFQRFAFTPKQLLFLLNRVYQYKIKHNPKDFRMTMRRNKDKEQLDDVNHNSIILIWPYMSAVQKTYYNDYVANKPITLSYMTEEQRRIFSKLQ